MSTGSINLYKSFTYSQPETYHFSHDSVFLARKVFETVRDENLPAAKILDLCSGCGIVGLDYAFHFASELGKTTLADFIEVQKVYEPFIIENIKTFNSLHPGKLTSQLIFENYEKLPTMADLKSCYDLILCNPPYFRTGQGKLSPSEFKNRCRFFIDSDFKQLIRSIHYLLTPKGSAFVLLQNLSDHNIDVLEEIREMNLVSVRSRGLIRSTGLYQIRKS